MLVSYMLLNMLKIKKYNRIILWLCFAVIFILYILTSCRTVPPYRDSGELITSAATLSVAHSPGYPTYLVLGKVFVMLGDLVEINPAWAMNILSSLAGALAVLFVILFIYELTNDMGVSVIGGFIAGVSYINWYLSTVAEMYSLNLMFVCFLLYLLSKRKYYLFSFIAGLTLGNHLTSLLALVPMFMYLLLLPEYRKKYSVKSVLFFMIGLSIYLYLPVRAQGTPFINWGDPSSYAGFFHVISRKAYGHTLDLISREVTLKQVLIPHLWFLLKSCMRDISPGLLILSFIGIVCSVRENNRQMNYFSVMLLAVFVVAGPVFLYMAKMPVNPHAIAIVEVGYMLPEMVLAVFAALGLFFLLRVIEKKFIRYVVLLLVVVILFVNTFKAYSRVDMSKNYIAEEYAFNILNSVENNAAVIMRKDHTMFSLWYEKDVENVRRDVKVISKGLISADWYRDKLKLDYPEVEWKDNYYSDENYIIWLYKKYSSEFPVYITPAVAGELSNDFFKNYKLRPYGLILEIILKSENYNLDELVKKIKNKYEYRSIYKTTVHYDFFSRDFIGLYAQYYDRVGLEYQRKGEIEKARKMYYKAIALDPYFYKAYSNLAFSFYTSSNMIEAIEFYNKAEKLIEKKLKEYTRRQFFYKDLAEVNNNLGAIYEKKLKDTRDPAYFDKALLNYNKAIELLPGYSQAYYNRGVLYWTRGEWEKVVENFEYASKYDAGNDNIKKYLKIARRNLRQK